jgi:DNA-binding IclR family transcriptional regulator
VGRTGLPASREVASVQRAADILAALAEAAGELGTTEVARRTGISASTCSRILATLTARDLVRHVPATGRYRLGLGLVRLAQAVNAGMELRSLARPHLAELSRQTGETATLSVPGDHQAVTVDFVPSSRSVRSVAEIGRPSAAHATAVGKVFLAYGGTLAAGPLTAFTTRTIVSGPALDSEITSVRAQGWAQAAGEREAGLNAVAAPVMDRTGTLAAILGVQGPAGRFGPRAMRAAAQSLTRHAAQLATVS